MGLDQYLNKIPRHKNTTIKEVVLIEDYFDWLQAKNDERKYEGSLKEWCGVDESKLPPRNIINHYSQYYTTKYPAWDEEHKYGFTRIVEQVGYWRKANQIHNYFVNAVQGGIDDCDYHHEVTKYILEDLLDTCQEVLDSCELVDGKIKNGETLKDGEWTPNFEGGKLIKDPSVAEELLPVTQGFFFGGYEYDEYYLQDIKDTIDIITKILKTTDFDKEAIYYISSW